MATTFATAKLALDEIAQRIVQNRGRLQQSQANAATANSDLAKMVTDYTTIVTDIDAMLADNPDHPSFQTLMADTKTTALTELTTPALEDLLYAVDDPICTRYMRQRSSPKITRAESTC